MGEIAEAMVSGLLCQFCGEYLDGEEPGHPRTCAGCKADGATVASRYARPEQPRKQKRKGRKP